MREKLLRLSVIEGNKSSQCQTFYLQRIRVEIKWDSVRTNEQSSFNYAHNITSSISFFKAL